MIRRCLFAVALLLAAGASARAATTYRITATGADGKAVTYTVTFEGGFTTNRLTAFDPGSKSFVYLTWRRADSAPKPAAVIWDHRTGETIPLYTFPGAAQPLPVIPNLGAMKVCPLTGDKKFQWKPISAE